MIRYRWYTVLALTCCGLAVGAQEEGSFAEYQQEQQRGLRELADTRAAEFEAYAAAERAAFNQFRETVGRLWGRFRGPSNKDWVEYGDDLHTRSHVDFATGRASVEVLVGPEGEGAREKLKQAVGALVLDEGRSADYSVTLPDGTIDEPKPLGAKPVLAGQVATKDGEPVDAGNAARFAEEVVRAGAVKTEVVQGGDGRLRTKAAVSFALVPDHLQQRVARFRPIIEREAERWGLEAALVFAIIHTESYFNPKARSAAPAYGLMQLMPATGGMDAYRHAYGRSRVLPPSYFYVPEQNVELGCAYLNLLSTVYFKGVAGERKNLFVTIASYNAGLGEVSDALAGSRNLRRAIARARGLDAETLYDELRGKLPTEENREYIRLIRERMPMYGSEALGPLSLRGE